MPGPEHAVDLDLVGLREPSFKVEPPAFLPSQLLYRGIWHRCYPSGPDSVASAARARFSDPMESCSGLGAAGLTEMVGCEEAGQPPYKRLHG